MNIKIRYHSWLSLQLDLPDNIVVYFLFTIHSSRFICQRQYRGEDLREMERQIIFFIFSFYRFIFEIFDHNFLHIDDMVIP